MSLYGEEWAPERWDPCPKAQNNGKFVLALLGCIYPMTVLKISALVKTSMDAIENHAVTWEKDLHDPYNHDGVITHLEPDILESEVKWAWGSITTNKASGGDGIPVELLQILRDDAVKVLHSVCQQIWKTQQWPQDWKRSVFIPIPKKGNAKECSNYHTIELISYTSKVIIQILQARLEEYINWEIPDVQAGFRKVRGANN